MKPYTAADVARIAGVSQSTVSYVMSGRRPISEDTRRRVQEVIERLTYEPNHGARALAGQKTRVIGLVVPFDTAADKAGLLPFIDTIASTLREKDYDLLLVTAREGTRGLSRIAGRRLCDGIILMDIKAVDDRIAIAAELGVPVVLIGVPDEHEGLTCVDLDFESAARLAIDEFADTGHDQVAVIGYPAAMTDVGLSFVHRLLTTARAQAAARGLRHTEISPIEFGRAGARSAVEQIRALHSPDERLGVFLAGSHSLDQLVPMLSAAGLSPGAELSLIALATDDDAADAEPQVSNVALDPHEVSLSAIRTLFELLNQPAEGVERLELVPTRLTRRATVMALPS
ncbi:LacI family DNA-binding transcriptional regulator [Kribbella sp. NPDC058245]|uniref:LacI family DNA-binding transcriptional regulator n=1 Tax=Kribbella sp. NPDC058245 TaxID=3346399 RepID=UPI0036E7ADA9